MPWVLIIGATGFYLNHGKMFRPLYQQPAFSEAAFDRITPPAPITRDSARRLGKTLWPDQGIKRISRKTYHGRKSYFVKKAEGNIILSIPTGHYYLRTRYTRETFRPDGRLLHYKFYWARALKDLHETGWLGGGLGTWLADIVALAMVAFGLTGVLMWFTHRVRRLRARRAASGAQ
jgi:hypothetical protein